MSSRWFDRCVRGATELGSWLWLLGLGFMGGCSFGDDAPMAAKNSCIVDTDCDSKRCEDGFCVMTGPKPLSVILEVTPKRMPDGSQPVPILAPPVALQGGGNTSFQLPLPITVPISIASGNDRLDAQFSFAPQLAAQALSKTTQVSTLGSGAKSGPAQTSVLLMSGVTYDVTVQPVNPQVPPHQFTYMASTETAIDINYADYTWQTRRFLVRNLPYEGVAIRARDKISGKLISNTVPLTAGMVSLKFDKGDGADIPPYLLELAPMASARASAGNDQCDQSSTLLPALTIDPATLPSPTAMTGSEMPSVDLDPADIVTTIELPKLPAAVQYSGSLRLCANQPLSNPRPSFPMTLKSSSLNLGSDMSMATITGSFETATAAMWDEGNQQFQFCARVVPGEYVIVATPPANVNCEIFAERRSLTADDDLGDAELELRTPATLMGTIVTPDMMRMSNASIDLLALGASNVVLAENDATVPTYNRSRQGTSDADGMFKLSADVGTYDVVIKPPTQSNFAWSVIYGVEIASRSSTFATQVHLNAPVAMNGTLSYQGAGKSVNSTLASADIHAYTIVDEGEPTARSIEIARSQADDKGNVMLLVTPDLQHTWTPL